MTRGRAAGLAVICLTVNAVGADRSAGAPAAHNGRIFFERGFDLYSIDPSGRNLRRITGTRAPEQDPNAGPGGTELVFRTANDEITRIRSNGTKRVNLTRNDAHDFAPAWSGRGTIAFTSSRAGGQTIWTMDRNGRRARRVSPADGEYPAWSRDGRWLAFSRPSGATYDLWVMRSNGTGLEQLTDTISVWEGTPSWSPDNRTIVFSRGDPNGGLGGRKLWLVDRAGGGLRQLTAGRGNDDFAPSWSPDGRQIAFTRNDRLFTIAASGARPRSLGVSPSLPDWAAAPG